MAPHNRDRALRAPASAIAAWKISPDEADAYWGMADGDRATFDAMLGAAGYAPGGATADAAGAASPRQPQRTVARGARKAAAAAPACPEAVTVGGSRQWWPAQALVTLGCPAAVGSPRRKRGSGPLSQPNGAAAGSLANTPLCKLTANSANGAVETSRLLSLHQPRPPEAPPGTLKGAASGAQPAAATLLPAAPGADRQPGCRESKPSLLATPKSPRDASPGRVGGEDTELDDLMSVLTAGDSAAGCTARLSAAPLSPMLPSPSAGASPATTPRAAATAAGTAASPILTARLSGGGGPPLATPLLPPHLLAASSRTPVAAASRAAGALTPLVTSPPPPPAASSLSTSPVTPLAMPPPALAVAGAALNPTFAVCPGASPYASPAPSAAHGPPRGNSAASDDDAPLVSRRGARAAAAIRARARPAPSPVPTTAPPPAAALGRRVPGVVCAGVFLTPPSREVLLSMLPAAHAAVRGDHMTLALRPRLHQLLALPLGAPVALRVIGQAVDSRAQALAVDPPVWLPPTTADATHITLSLAPGVAVSEAGALLGHAMERAAAGEPAWGGVEGMVPPGAYEHFAEPLELPGIVGVELEGGERLFSLDALAARCGLDLAPEQLAAYAAAHGARLHGVDPPPPAMARAPYATSRADERPFSRASSASGVSGVAAAAAGTLASLPPPPSARLLRAAAPPALAPAADSGLDDFWGALEGGPAAAAAALAHSPTARGPPPPPPSPRPAMGACSSPKSRSSGSSSSGEGPVVYRSAVRVGDWALVAPMLEEEAWDDAGRRALVMREGWVKDVLLDEAYQPDGVLVLLTDNTIGRVQSITDPRVAQLTTLIGGADAPSAPAAARSGAPSAASKAVLKPLRNGAGGAAAATPRKTCGGLSDAGVSLLDCAQPGGGAAASAGGTAKAGHDDVALWHEFAQLEAAHGEALCGAILAGCGDDFEAAIRTIRGQAAAASATAVTPVAPSASPRAPAGAGAGAGGGGGSGAGARSLEVQLLAEAFCVPPAAALQLCDMLRDADPAAAVEALARAKGDVNAAAEALLLGGLLAAVPPRPPAAAADELSEADQLEMLRAMGMLRDAPARRGGKLPPASPPRVPAAVTPPPLPQWGPDRSVQELREMWGSPAPAPAVPAAASTAAPAHLRLLAPPLRKHEAPSAEGWAEPKPRECGGGSGGGGNGRGPVINHDELLGLSSDQLRAKAAEMREKANRHFQSARVYGAAAQEVIFSGNEPKFAEFIRKSNEEAAKGKRLMAEVNRIAIRASNLGNLNEWVCDVHGASRAAAVHEVSKHVAALDAIAGSGGAVLRVITGKGKHSKDGVSVVRAEVLQYLRETGYRHELQPGNDGVVLVYFGGPDSGGGVSTSYAN